MMVLQRSFIPRRIGKIGRFFTALDWLARLVETDDTIPTVIPNEISSKEFRRNWARLIQKIYEVDPLTCPKCQGSMRIISFIEELDIIP